MACFELRVVCLAVFVVGLLCDGQCLWCFVWLFYACYSGVMIWLRFACRCGLVYWFGLNCLAEFSGIVWVLLFVGNAVPGCFVCWCLGCFC